MKTITLILVALTLATPTYAADKKLTTREKIREAKAKDRETLKTYLEPKDKNKDGSLTRSEFLSDEADQEAAGKRFDEANKNGDRYLSKSEISTMLGLGAEAEKLKQAEKDKNKKK